MNQQMIAELHFFLTAILWGIGLVFLYDILRILRRIIRHNYFFIGLEDIIYWTIAGVLIFHMMYQQNDGIIRGFAILGICLGMYLYHISLSELLVAIISKSIHFILKTISKVLSFLINLLLKPLKVIWKLIRKVISFVHKKWLLPLKYFIHKKFSLFVSKLLKNKTNDSTIETNNSETEKPKKKKPRTKKADKKKTRKRKHKKEKVAE